MVVIYENVQNERIYYSDENAKIDPTEMYHQTHARNKNI